MRADDYDLSNRRRHPGHELIDQAHECIEGLPPLPGRPTARRRRGRPPGRAEDGPHEVPQLLQRVMLRRNKLDVLAKKFKVTLDEIRKAADLIKSLEPKPGRPFLNSDTVYVVPDIFIIRLGNDYSIMLNYICSRI